MTTNYRASITSFGAYSQSQMIVEELKEDFANQFDDTTYRKLVQLLDVKTNEITKRYKRK